jgi:hypothetical protein
MPFEIPKHAIPAFLRLVEIKDLSKHVWMWGQYMDSFDRPLFIETGEHIFETPTAMHHAGFTTDHELPDAMQWCTAMLTELFEGGLIIATGVADRLTVTPTDTCFVLSYESIGRMRDWCWINQRADEQFRLDRPYDLMKAIVRRFPEPWNNIN